jgi:hypothetical protein
MIKILASAALAGSLALAPLAAEAAGWIPSDDPKITDANADIVLFGGDVFLEALAPVLTANGTSAAGAPAQVSIDGGPGFDPSYVMMVWNEVGELIIEGEAAYTGSTAGGIEWGFILTTDATGLFGSHAMAFAKVDPAFGDPLASGIDEVTVAGLAVKGVSEVPVPAALPLLATALGGLAIARRRARKSPAE